MIREINRESPSFNHFLRVPAQKVEKPCCRGFELVRRAPLGRFVGPGGSRLARRNAYWHPAMPASSAESLPVGFTELLPIKNPHGR